MELMFVVIVYDGQTEEPYLASQELPKMEAIQLCDGWNTHYPERGYFLVIPACEAIG